MKNVRYRRTKKYPGRKTDQYPVISEIYEAETPIRNMPRYSASALITAGKKSNLGLTSGTRTPGKMKKLKI
jgi:hypothetical protein